MENTTKSLLRFLPLVLLLGLIMLVWAMGWQNTLSFQNLQTHKEQFLQTVQNQPIISTLAFSGTYIAAVALSLPFATLLTLLGGFLFGKWLGTLIVVTSATIGATILFLIAKTSLGETLRSRAGKYYDKMAENMEENAVNYLFFLRLVPLFPFWLVNIVPALFNINLRTFLFTTFFGIIPGSFVYVNLGETLGDIESLKDLISIETLVAFTMLGIFALMPSIYKQLKNNKKTALTLCAALIICTPAQTNANAHYEFTPLFNILLKKHTAPAKAKDFTYTGVNYETWKNDPNHAKALELLLSANPETLSSKEEKLAYWINAYNFLTIDLIIKNGEKKSIKNLGGILATPWNKFSWKINDKPYTLDHIEHKILRSMKEPRIHFAINCAAISCTDLRAEAYNAQHIDKQFDQQVRSMLDNEGKGFKADPEHNVVYVSKIFDWFEEDFKNPNVRQWLKTYKPHIIKNDTTIVFLPYDWSLNKIGNKNE